MDNSTKKGKFPGIVRGIIIIIVVALLLVVALRSMIKSNELTERLEALSESYKELEYENEKLKNELEKPLDDDNIKQIAEDELGLADPNAEYYYSD